jgi:hypothetical protein
LLELQSIKNNVGSISSTTVAQPNSARSTSAEKSTKLRLTEAQFKAIIQKLQNDLQEKVTHLFSINFTIFSSGLFAKTLKKFSLLKGVR